MLEDQDKQKILILDMVCTNEGNKTEKRSWRNTKVPTIILRITRKIFRIYSESCYNED